MELISGLDYIVVDHFAPYRIQTNSNRFEFPHAFFVGVIPLAGAAAIAYFANQFVAANAGAIVAVYAVMASVMTAIMPTINGLIGEVDRGRVKALKDGSTTSDTNIDEVRSLIAKVEIVRGLYAAVGWSVIVLCVSLLPLLAISHSVFQGDIKTPTVDVGICYRSLRIILAGLIGFAGSTAFVALLQIVSGIHLMTRHSQIDIQADLTKLKSKYKL